MKKLLLLLAGILLGAIVAEAAIQVWAYVMTSREPARESLLPADLRLGILCAGDSFTAGLGAPPDGAYPLQLQRLLDEKTPRAFRVGNAGIPGFDSRDLLQTLGNPLASFRAERVYVLIGTNDRWSMPARLDEGAEQEPASDAGFRWRLRLPRLLALIFQPRPPAAPAQRADGASTIAGRLRELESKSDRLGAVAYAKEVGPRVPRDPAVCNLIMRYGETGVERDAVRDAIEHTVAALPAGTPGRSLWMRMHANLFFRDDPRGALKMVIVAFQEDRERAATIQPLRRGAGLFDRPLVDDLLREIGASEDLSSEFRGIFESTATPGSYGAVLREHLTRVVALCRSHGAEPVLLTYPKPDVEVDPIVQDVSDATGCRRIDLRPTFEDSALRARGYAGARSVLVSDGHCNSAGYRLIAELIRDDVVNHPPTAAR